MQAEPDEIDLTIAKVIHEAEDWQTPAATCTQCADIARAIRSALRSSGYVIAPSTAALLAKGNEAVKLHE